MRQYAAIILSAGYSSRMDDFKPLSKLCSQTPLERNINLFRSAGINNIYVVAGYKWKSVRDFVGTKAQVIYNKNFDKGMISSVKAGIKQLPGGIDAFFVMPVDIPFVKMLTVKMLIEAYEKGNYKVVYPTFSKKRGHPPLISISLLNEILEYNGKCGLKNILSLYEDNSADVKVADRGVLMDMDTKEDYDALLDYASYFPCPDEQECKEMMRLCGVRDDVVLHMKSVGRLSKTIAQKLSDKGFTIDVKVAYAGGLLHDIGKGKKEHAKEGALIVEKFGYPCLYEIIKDHMNIGKISNIGEKEIVYISDKLIKGTKAVTLEERFEPSFHKYKDCPKIIDNVSERFNTAKEVKAMIENVIGYGIEKLQEDLWID